MINKNNGVENSLFNKKLKNGKQISKTNNNKLKSCNKASQNDNEKLKSCNAMAKSKQSLMGKQKPSNDFVNKNLTLKDKEQIKQMLKKWLGQIQQDNPLPYEIKNIYFIVDFANNDIELSFSASDRDLKVFDYGFYQPLEAEYFFCLPLKKLAKKMPQKKSKPAKQQVFLFLKELCLSVCNSLDFLQHKRIFVGKRFDIIQA
ncbi:MAG: hypothetical protein ACI4TZ_01365 [Christensenellales bacterium]